MKTLTEKLTHAEEAEARRELFTFIKSLVGGLIASIPIIVWLAPRSGRQMRQGIRQQGYLIRRKAGSTVGQVGDQIGQIQNKVGQQIEQAQQKVRGDSIEDAIEEGKAIAAQRRTG